MSDSTKYGKVLFNNVLKQSAKQGKQFRSEYPKNFAAVQDAQLSGDAKARSAAVDFLSTMGERTRESALSANPDLKARLLQIDQTANEMGRSDIGQKLHDQALSELDQGGSLSPEEMRNVTQATRSGFADRGMGMGNPALFAEALNRAEASHARLRDRQGFASQVDQQLYGQEQGDRSFLLNAASASQAYDPTLTILGINSTPASTGAQSFTENASQAPMGVAGMQHDYWNTMFNANAAKDIASANRFAGLKSAKMSAGASSSAGTSSMLGSLGGSALGAAGAIGGALLLSCWVAREIYGAESDDWRVFRHWLLTEAPEWFRNFYLRHGAAFAKWLSSTRARTPIVWLLKPFFNSKVRAMRRKWNHSSYSSHLSHVPAF